jgi:hypothetical protein
MDEARAELLRVLHGAREVLERRESHLVGDHIEALVGGIQALLKAALCLDYEEAEVEQWSWWKVAKKAARKYQDLKADREIDSGLRHMYDLSNPQRHAGALSCEPSLIHLCRAFNAVVKAANIVGTGGPPVAPFPVEQVIRPTRRPPTPDDDWLARSEKLRESVELGTFDSFALRLAYVAYYRQVARQVVRELEKRTGREAEADSPWFDMDCDLPAEAELLVKAAWGDDEEEWEPFNRALLRRAQGTLLYEGGVALGRDETLGMKDPARGQRRYMADAVVRVIRAVGDIEFIVDLLDPGDAGEDQAPA